MRTWKQRLRLAKENEDRDEWELENKCRAAAKFLSKDEEKWVDLVDLIYYIEAGRLTAIDERVWTDAEKESWRNYMMNR